MISSPALHPVLSKTLLAVALVASAAITGIPAAQAQNVATVNGRPIKTETLNRFIAEIGRPETPELRNAVREELISREILSQEAEKRGLAQDPAVAFQLNTSRQQVLVQALVKSELDRNPVTDAEVKAAYDQQVGQAGREINARHILVKSEAEAKDIIKQLKAGASFEKLAAKSLDTGSAAAGGSLGWANPEMYVPPFAAAIKAMKEGELTQAPVQSNFGWHVIRVEGVREAEKPSLESVAPQLREALQRDRLLALQDRLKKKAVVR